MKQQKIINGHPFISYKKKIYTEDEMRNKSNKFFLWLNKRRSIRAFSDKPISKSLIENLLKAASTAPSGAHKQPWTFCIVSDAALKKQIRIAAEKEEYESYNGRMSEEWIKDLAPLQTDWHKEFLETAPY
ncbi:MAG: nitroreductase family protein, partial [Parafilimonas sp.]